MLPFLSFFLDRNVGGACGGGCRRMRGWMKRIEGVDVRKKGWLWGREGFIKNEFTRRIYC